MHLFLTSVLPFLAHNHASAAAFLTCRHHNFHASIVPEFLSDEDRVTSFCEARQQNQLNVDDKETPYKHLYNLFVQTPLMQFSPSLVFRQKDCFESIIKPLLATKYFTRTLQRCTVRPEWSQHISNELLQGLSSVRSLTNLELAEMVGINNEQFGIIIKSFPSLETLAIRSAYYLDPTTTNISSPPPPATKTLRNLTIRIVDAMFATQFVPQFTNLRKLRLSGDSASQELDLHPLSSSLPFLTDLDLASFMLYNTESLKNLVHLSSLSFAGCPFSDLSFPTYENSFPHLTALCFDSCKGLSTSQFASLAHAPNLHVLNLHYTNFDNDCLPVLANMVHLQKLDLSNNGIVGDSRSLKTLLQNLFQLEELNLSGCRIGNQGALSGALYSTHSRLRVLNLSYCDLVDDDLNGIGLLKNTLEVLHLTYNSDLTNEALVHCKDLVKLKVLNLRSCDGIDDLSPLKGCLNLEELDASFCDRLTDDSFRVYSEEPNSFPNLRVLNLSDCRTLTEKVFEHLSRNNYLVDQLTELDARGMSDILSSSSTARNRLYKLKGLRRLKGIHLALYRLPMKTLCRMNTYEI